MSIRRYLLLSVIFISSTASGHGIYHDSISKKHSHSHDVVKHKQLNRLDSLRAETPEKGALASLPQLDQATSCSTDALLAAAPAEFVKLVRVAKENNCVSPLNTLPTAQARIAFSSANMVAVANEVSKIAPAYTGSNNYALEQMVYYLRLGYVTNLGRDHQVSVAQESAVAEAIRALFSNQKIFSKNNDNALVLRELVSLAENSREYNLALPYFFQVLNSYRGSDDSSNSFGSAVFNVIYALGSIWGTTEGKPLLEADTKIVDAYTNFIKANAELVGKGNEYLLTNAVLQSGRLLKSENDQIKIKSQELLKYITTTYAYDGHGAGLWLTAADKIEEYDSANCQFYGTCDHTRTIRTQLFSEKVCTSEVTITYQQSASINANNICDIFSQEESRFHKQFATGRKVVADDYTKKLEVVIFSSRSDYTTYGPTLYNISTNNGGIYLEGDPSDPDNIARFFVYTSNYAPGEDGGVTNIRHEFGHWLDGRYNLYGGFGLYWQQRIFWWIEAAADFIAYNDNFGSAIDIAYEKRHKLSNLFKLSSRDYRSENDDQLHEYGYLAIRFMRDNHPEDFAKILDFYRRGAYDEAETFIDNIGTSYDDEFDRWLGTITFAGSLLPEQAEAQGYILLSSLTPIESRVGSGQVTINRNYNNGIISFNGQRYAIGVGAHASSELIYDLNREYQSFQAVVGVTDSAREQVGEVTFQIFLDDQRSPVFSNVMSGKDPGKPTGSIDVSGVQKMRLVVLSNGSQNSDHSVWAEALLTKVGVTIKPLPPVNPGKPTVPTTPETPTVPTTPETPTVPTTPETPTVPTTPETPTVPTTPETPTVPTTPETPPTIPPTTPTTPGQGDTVLLTELSPDEYQVAWGELGVNQDIYGNAIHVNNRAFTSALLVHGNSTLLYSVKGQYQSFSALIGVEDAFGESESVTFNIYRDNESTPVFTGRVKGGEAAIPTDTISLTGVQSLRLEVITAGENEAAVWAEPVLTLKEGGLPQNVSYLSDLTALDTKTEWGRVSLDISTQRLPMKLQGQTYSKGIAIHSNGEASFELDGQFTKLTAILGIDDFTGGKGSVIFAVYGDGQLLGQTYSRSGASPNSERVEFNVTGVKRLTLKVTDSGDDRHWDHAAFFDARLQ